MNIGDSARQRIEDDELDRAAFSEKLARAIAMTPFSDEARVVALFGEWGCGKTTLKYFTAHYLRTAHKIEPINFSPWEWSGRDRLLDAFFVQVGTALRRSKWFWQDLALAYSFRRYAVALGLFAPLVTWGRAWWLPLLMFLSGGTSFLTRDLWSEGRNGLWSLAAIVGAGGALLLLLQIITEGLAGYAAKLTELRRNSLDRVRDHLAVVLCRHGKPVVVFIDDLDRLEATEIRQVITLIKATANLPRVTFVILCQRYTVARALDEVAGGPGCGEQFLEKVVQTSLHVPQPPSGRIADMLTRGVRRMLKESRFADQWEWDRWNDIHGDHLAQFFRTPRHVARYLESLPLYLHQHVHGERLEINPVDVAALEVLRMFEPAVFEHLAAEPIIFDVNFLYTISSDSRDRLGKVLERIATLASEPRRQAVRGLLLALVPQLHPGHSIPEATRDSWDMTMRVCHGNHYDKYFQLVLPQGYVTTAEFERIRLVAARGHEEVSAELRGFENRGLLRSLLGRFHVAVYEMPADARRNVYLSLCKLGDRLPELRGYDEDDWLKVSADGVANDLLRECTKEDRVRWIADALSARAGLDFPVSVVARLNRKTELGTIDLQVDPTDEEDLKISAMQRLRQAAADGSLWQSAWLGWHLGYWRRCEGSAPVREWLKGEVQSSAKALRLVMSLVAVSTSARAYYPRLHAAVLDDYVDLELLEKLLPEMPEKPRERDAVILLKKATERKHAGEKLGDVKLNDSDP